MTSIRQCWVGWGNTLVQEITATASFVYTLNASPTFGQIQIIKDVGGNFATYPVSISGGNLTIDGATSYLMNLNYMSTIFYYDGSQWNVLATESTGGGGGGTETGTVINAGGPYNLASVTPGSPKNYVITTTSPVTINIPAPNSISPWGRVNITDQSGNPNVTVVPASGLVNGAAGATLNAAYESGNFLDFGTGWAIQ